MSTLESIKNMLAGELRKDESQIDLAYAALLIAQYLTQPFAAKPYLSILDDIAGAVQPMVKASVTDKGMIEALNYQLFEQMGFAGNVGNYYHPDNSFLNKVLEQKKGIPISLSVIYLEVGQRLNLPLWGIGMPRHFIVGYGSTNDPIYIDVFDRGQIISEDDCLAISHVSLDNRLAFRKEYLKPVTKKAMLYRMVLNLKYIYVGHKNWKKAYRAVDLLLVIDPSQTSELKDRGLLAYRLDQLRDAAFDLNRYLYLTPDGDDAEWLKARLEIIEERLLRLN